MFRILLLILLLPQIVFATERFVRCSTGSDSNDGLSWANAYLTIQECIDNSTHGDICSISDNEACSISTDIVWTSFTVATANGWFRVRGSDDPAGDSITIQRPDEASSRKGASIDGSGTATSIFTVSSHPIYVAYENIKFTNTSSHLMRVAQFVSFFGCEFSNPGNSNQLLRSNSYAEIVGNYFHSSDGNKIYQEQSWYSIRDNWVESGSASAIHLTGSARGGVVRNNVVVITNGIDAIYCNGRENRIENNTLVSSDGAASATGLDLVSCYGGNIVNNVFYNFDGTGAKPVQVSFVSSLSSYGNNHYYDCNTGDSPDFAGLDLTSNDINTTGDPFVDSAGDNYCVTGSSSEDASYGFTGNLIDVGALECTTAGAGGSGSGSCIFNGC